MTGDGIPRLHLRAATPDDAPAMQRIYAHYVATSCCTFEEVPPAPDEMRARWRHVTEAGLPWLVAQSEAGAVLGYAYAALFRTRSAYRYTLENSVYVAHDRVARGIGLALMHELILASTALGYRQMVAVIGDTANEASIRLHARLGFRKIGHQLAVGFKFGRWVDVIEMQLALGEGAGSPPKLDPSGYIRT